MSRRRLFKNQLKKNPKSEYSESVVVKTNRKDIAPRQAFGNISFNEEMLTYETLSGEFEHISECFDSLSSGVSGLSADFYTLSADVLTLTDELSGKIGFDDLIIEKTWEQLMDMKTNSNLVPGQQYRITDYVATVANDPNAQSANHPFDLIVVADSENKLNEKTRAIRHVGDTYFPASVKFEAWQVWYCLDNDTTRFAWADATNGKGVIYRLIDEWRNDCPYDFKGIQFKRWAITNVTSNTLSQDVIDILKNMFVTTLNDGRNLAFQSADIVAYDPIGDPFYTLVVDGSTFSIHYTFDSGEGSDCSLSGGTSGTNVYGNTLKPNETSLNNIVFLGDGCYFNIFGDGCYANTFGDGCYANTFGDYCQSNTFGSDCYFNAFGSACNSNIFGSACNYNTFGYDCYANTFGDYCQSNTFGSGCYFNAFVSDGCFNTFGDGCVSNIFGSACNYNTFGDGCYANTFGDYCYANTFGDYCQSNTFGADPSDPAAYYQYITFESGVNTVFLVCTHSSASVSMFQNVTVAKGVADTTISDPNIEQNYKTTYEASGSQTITVEGNQ